MVDDVQLIAQFSQSYLSARQLVAAGDRKSALAAYQQLLVIYRQMDSSGMEMIHREFAHDQLTQLYSLLSNKSVPQAAQVSQIAPAQATTLPIAQTSAFTSPFASQPAPTWQVPQSQLSQSQQAPAAPPWMTTSTGEMPPAFGAFGQASAQQGAIPAAKAVQMPQSFLSGFSSKELLLVGVFVLFIGIVVFIKPEVIGLAVLDDIGITVPVDTLFKTGGPLTLTLAENPTSLRISGQMTGAGRAQVWLVMPTGRKLLFDSGLQDLPVDGDSRRIDRLCLDTCFLEGVTKDITLEVELQNADLTIDSVTYTRKGATNAPPRFHAASDTVGLVAGQPTAFDLSQFFTDDDGDRLVFLAGDAPGVNVEVSGSTLTLMSASSGTQSIPLLASDGADITRAQLRLLVR